MKTFPFLKRPLAKPLILSAVIFIIIISYYFTSRSLTNPAPDTRHHKPYERIALISIDSHGFNPQSMILSQGTILYLKNDTTENHSLVLSMPFHQITEPKPLKTGESWTIRPMALGKWELSDKNSSLKGEITVKSNPNLSEYLIDEDPQIPTGMNVLDRLQLDINLWIQQLFSPHHDE